MEDQRSNENAITPFAITNYRDIRKRFGIKQKNRRGHMYIVGKTGTGKSTLIQNMAAHDIEAGYGMALIDPHGDLAEAILDSVPTARVNDVIYLNPADLGYPVAFNPLENVPSDQRHLVASGIISTLKKVWADFWGPRLEHILRHSLLTLLEFRGSTILDVPRLLTDEAFRETVISQVSNPHVRQFWNAEFGRYSAWMRLRGHFADLEQTRPVPDEPAFAQHRRTTEKRTQLPRNHGRGQDSHREPGQGTDRRR